MGATKKLTRRNILRGAGSVALGLPFLEGLAPRTARAQDGNDLSRLIVLMQVNGVDVTRFWPTQGAGAISASNLTGTALESLAPYADRLLIPRGLFNSPLASQGTPGDIHGQGIAHKLTCAPMDFEMFSTGTSVDQVVASNLNPDGTPALTLRSGRQITGHMGHISYISPGVPSVGELSPWLAYQDLVGLSNLDPLELERIVARRESVLDLVGDEFDTLMANSKLSQHDREKLDMHSAAIRDLELDMLDNGLVACEWDEDIANQVEELHNSGGIGLDELFPYQTEAHIRLLALAIACGANRAATLLLGSGAYGPIYTWDGMNHQYNHHKLSHGNTQDDDTGAEIPGFLDMVFDIDKWTMRQYALLLDLLDAYEEGDGTVLDNSAVVFTNSLSDGFIHSQGDLPFLVAGSAGGVLKRGEYFEVSAQGSPTNQFWTSILNAVGVRDADGGPVQSFGDMSFGQPGQLDYMFA